MPFPIRVEDVMSRPVHTVGGDTTAADAATECVEKDIRSLVVVENGRVAGIVTGEDLLDVLGSKTEPGLTLTEDVMSSPVVTTSPEMPVHDAVATMYERGINRLVVLDGDNLVGLVTTDDVARYVPQVLHRHELGKESGEQEHEYAIRRETAYEKEDSVLHKASLANSV